MAESNVLVVCVAWSLHEDNGYTEKKRKKDLNHNKQNVELLPKFESQDNAESFLVYG